MEGDPNVCSSGSTGDIQWIANMVKPYFVDRKIISTRVRSLKSIVMVHFKDFNKRYDVVVGKEDLEVYSSDCIGEQYIHCNKPRKRCKQPTVKRKISAISHQKLATTPLVESILQETGMFQPQTSDTDEPDEPNKHGNSKQAKKQCKQKKPTHIGWKENSLEAQKKLLQQNSLEPVGYKADIALEAFLKARHIGSFVEFKNTERNGMKTSVQPTSHIGRITNLCVASDNVICHVQFYILSGNTLLGSTGEKNEIFQLMECKNFAMRDLKVVNAEQRPPDWKFANKKTHTESKLWYSEIQLIYCKQSGTFYCEDEKPTKKCMSCQRKIEKKEFNTPILVESEDTTKTNKFSSVEWQDMSLQEGSFIYVSPSFWQLEDTVPYQVCQIIEILLQGGKVILKVQLFKRPDEHKNMTYKELCSLPITLLYYSNETTTVPLHFVCGTCEVKCNEENWSLEAPNRFFYVKKKYQQPPTKKMTKKRVNETNKTGFKANSFGLKPVDAGSSTTTGVLQGLALYSGAGGLTEGLKQSGVVNTKWAIEKNKDAAQTFLENNPSCDVIHDDANNVLLAMQKGDVHYNNDTPLPTPGDVDIIYGGPPCQAFSNLNQHQDGMDAKRKAEMMVLLLSYVEYLSPKLLLVENVRSLVTHKNSCMITLMLRVLHTLGYQTRFGVLQVANFGIPQSRRRFILFAAKSGVTLPNFPMPTHAFNFTYLNMSIDGGMHKLTTYPQEHQPTSAPFRAMTVYDAIGDLPDVKNQTEVHYCKKPMTNYQNMMQQDDRAVLNHVKLHLSKKDDIRLKHLHQIKSDSYKGLPKNLLPAYLSRGNFEKSYGKLKYHDVFDTITTTAKPSQKMGKLRHPIYCRIVGARELARAQSFPDSFVFTGSNNAIVSQIGNAVPPLFARHLGLSIASSLER